MSKFYFLFTLLITHPVFARSLSAQINKSQRDTKTVIIALIPILATVVAYFYMRGKQEASERLERFIMGLVVLGGAAAFATFAR